MNNIKSNDKQKLILDKAPHHIFYDNPEQELIFNTIYKFSFLFFTIYELESCWLYIVFEYSRYSFSVLGGDDLLNVKLFSFPKNLNELTLINQLIN